MKRIDKHFFLSFNLVGFMRFFIAAKTIQYKKFIEKLSFYQFDAMAKFLRYLLSTFFSRIEQEFRIAGGSFILSLSQYKGFPHFQIYIFLLHYLLSIESHKRTHQKELPGRYI